MQQLQLNIDWDKVRISHLQSELDKAQKQIESLSNSLRSYKGHNTRKNKLKN